MRKKEKITYKKERVVLSDILPYEVPAIFNNRSFYRFLVENKIESKNNEIKCGNNEAQKIVDLIFSNERTISFEFRISHKNNSYRSLSIMHPRNQLATIAFYNEFKETIKYFASISQYSIRKPHKVAKIRFINDYLHKQKKEFQTDSNIEIEQEKQEHLKTFFAYKKYSNIHYFFESHEYQKCEKKFKYLYKFDISKCFDSIYTHSISWALYNKEIVKDNIENSKGTFAGKFDALMQNMNYGETNGILIGSEVSRIFAELLLQQIDKCVFDELFKSGRVHKRDYQVFRYVDDYFLFYNDEIVKEEVFGKFIHDLKQCNLFINEVKTYQYSRPIITELTIAKTKIRDLISKHLSVKIFDKEEEDDDIIKIFNKEEEEQGIIKKWRIDFNSIKLITRLKIIIKESNIEFKDIINFSIAVVERRVLKIISKIEKQKQKQIYLKDFINYIYSVLDFVFFVYSEAPRVSATIKIVSLISKLLVFIEGNKEFKKHQKDYLHKKIFDEIYQIIKVNKNKKYVQNETLYLLITLAELDRHAGFNAAYKIESEMLEASFISDKNAMNYFSITVLLFYIKNQDKYESLKEKIITKINEKFKNHNQDNLKKDAENIMLLLDLLSCPFIKESDKKIFLTHFNITKNKKYYIEYRKEWFIKWEGFNLANEMEMKKSQEVYA